MKLLKLSLGTIRFLNDKVLKLSSAVGIVAIAAMVIAILVQVYFRYVK